MLNNTCLPNDYYVVCTSNVNHQYNMICSLLATGNNCSVSSNEEQFDFKFHVLLILLHKHVVSVQFVCFIIKILFYILLLVGEGTLKINSLFHFSFS